MIIGKMGQDYSREICGKKKKLWVFPKRYFRSTLYYVVIKKHTKISIKCYFLYKIN